MTGSWTGDARTECEHLSATGVDQTDARDPAKVWRCDGCGFTYREVPTARSLGGIQVVVPFPVVPCTRCDGRGDVVTEGDFTMRDGSRSTEYHDQCPDCSSTGWVALKED